MHPLFPFLNIFRVIVLVQDLALLHRLPALAFAGGEVSGFAGNAVAGPGHHPADYSVFDPGADFAGRLVSGVLARRPGLVVLVAHLVFAVVHPA